MSKRALRSRYLRIVFFFASVVGSLIVWELLLPRLGLRRRVERSRPERLRRIAASFRELAIQMGGVLIKVGQFLSSRLDVLPPEITEELANLQDAVPAEDFSEIRSLLETELGATIRERFVEFEQVPAAAASLGQVHHARITVASTSEETSRPSTAVVVKVQRPHIEELIAVDLAAVCVVGAWLHRYRPIRKRANVPALIREFSRTLYEEIDYLAEGRNAETFAANFAQRAGVCIPRPIWPYTTRRVLTLEDVTAIKVTDYEAITRAGVDRAEVAQRLLDTYLKQIFEDGFFHADPHPGNLFVAAGASAEAWQLTFVDFGMVGRIPANLDEGLREAVIGLGTRDAGRLVKSFQLLDMLLPEADLALLERAVARMLERAWGMSMQEMREMSMEEMREIADEFRELIYAMPFQIPQDLILFGRTLAILSGMCTGLDPQFNLWEGLVPYAQKMLADEAGSRGAVLWEEAKRLGGALLALPGRSLAILDKMERGELAVRVPQVADHLSRLERSVRRLAGSLIFVTLGLSGTEFLLAGQAWVGGILLGASVITLVWVMLTR